mgnify:FL=1
MITIDQRLSCVLSHKNLGERFDIIGWGHNNIGNYGYAWRSENVASFTYRYYFKNKRDLAWFKMVWL